MEDRGLRGRALRSTVTAAGTLELWIDEVVAEVPAPDEVVVRIEAAPINPSDLGLLIGPADLTTMRMEGSAARPVLTATVPPTRMAALARRIDQPLPVGNEGAGTVVAAGADVQAMLGRRVGLMGGGTYAQFRTIPARECILLPDGASAADGAAMFINPLTALAMLGTMRREGHHAILHTAAASSLGLMLNRLCLAEDVGLVNIVRSPPQVTLLRDAGARYVVDSSAPDFGVALVDAVTATGATIAFDAVGGGRLANDMLRAMEVAANRNPAAANSYGSSTHKQVYIYGGLDPSPTQIDRSFGMAWGTGGFLLPLYLQKAGWEETLQLRARVAADLTTIFATRYTATVGLADMLEPDTVRAFARKATGGKYLLDPQR